MKRLLFLLALLLPAAALAQNIPQAMNYQGRLAKPDGTPVPDGAYTVTFSLYDDPAAGNLLWHQTGTVTARNGAFAASLNFATGFEPNYALYNTFGSGAPFLQIKIGTNAPLTPRQTFSSVAYSLYAETANRTGYADYANAAGDVTPGSLTAASFATGALNFGVISGQVTGNQIAPGAIVGSITSAQAAAVAKLSALAQPGLASDTVIGSYNYNGIKIVGRYAYILKSSYGNLQVYDIANPALPLPVSDTYLGYYSTDFAIAGHYAYILNGYDQRLEIVDITSPVAPALLSTTPLAGGIQLYHIAVSGSTAYISNYDGASSEYKVAIYNVSNTAAPALVGSFTLGANGYPGSLAISGSTLYVGADNGISVYDITTPAAPALRGSVSSNGSQYLTVVGSIVYVGGYNYVSAVDVSNPNSPTLLGEINTGNNESIMGIAATDATVSVLCAIYPGGSGTPLGALQTYNFSNPAAPVLKSALPTDVNPSVVAGNFASVFVISLGDLTVGNNVTLQAYDLFGTLQVNSALAVSGGATFSGSVGIGTTAPAYKLDVAGDINASGSVRANGVALTSDARYKTNVAPLYNALDDVLDLRGVSYDYDREKWPAKNFPEGRQIGFIAQEMEKIFPELVDTDAKGYKSVKYQNMTPILVEAIKTLKAQIDEKQKQIDELRGIKTENAELKKQNAEILDKLAALAALVNKMQPDRK